MPLVIMNPAERDFVSDEPMFWHESDGWVSIDTDDITKMDASETASYDLPTIGCPLVQWIDYERAKQIVKLFRAGDYENGEKLMIGSAETEILIDKRL